MTKLTAIALLLTACSATDYRSDREVAMGVVLSPEVIEIRQELERQRRAGAQEQLRREQWERRLRDAYYTCYDKSVVECL